MNANKFAVAIIKHGKRQVYDKAREEYNDSVTLADSGFLACV